MGAEGSFLRSSFNSPDVSPSDKPKDSLVGLELDVKPTETIQESPEVIEDDRSDDLSPQ